MLLLVLLVSLSMVVTAVLSQGLVEGAQQLAA